MKFNKKITVVSLSTVLGLGLVGSITGAVAWYQYSTRTTSSIIGTSTGNGGTLQIKANGGSWKRDLITSDVSVTEGNTKFAGFQPVTFGETAKNAALPANAYKQPVRSEADMTKWAAAAAGNDKNADYLQYTINLQALQLNGNANERVEKAVYITDFVIQDHDTSDALDISDAVRIHLAVTDSKGSRYFLISKNNLGTGMATHGNLDLDGDGELDKADRYEFEAATSLIDYGFLSGDHSNVQTAYYLDDGVEDSHASNIVATKTNGNIDANQDDKIIGYTPADNNSECTIVVTIWNEGWQKFAGDTANSDAMWDPAKRNNAQFDVGFTFDIGDHAF